LWRQEPLHDETHVAQTRQAGHGDVLEDELAGEQPRRVDPLPPFTVRSRTSPVSMSMKVKIFPTPTEPPTKNPVLPPFGSSSTAG
jgi:hypothetical protein